MNKGQKIRLRNEAIALLWMEGHSLADIGALFDLGLDRLHLILLGWTAARNRPKDMTLDAWREANPLRLPAARYD